MPVEPELTWLQAITRVLSEARGALHYTEIAERIATQGLRTSLGATPASSVSATITTDAKRGEGSTFLRVGEGMVMLRSAATGVEPPADPQPLPAEAPAELFEPAELAEEEETTVIRALGMFWKRDMVHWVGTPSLLGVQQLSATPVNFCDQRGVYLLYDGREVVYVGRTTDRPLGRRLFEHTRDRLNVRWDRFSWFGTFDVSSEGALIEQDVPLSIEQVIIELEAVLIEALEPRQNRRRGDGLRAIEYNQVLDRRIQNQKLLSAIDEFKANLIQGD